MSIHDAIKDVDVNIKALKQAFKNKSELISEMKREIRDRQDYFNEIIEVILKNMVPEEIIQLDKSLGIFGVDNAKEEINTLKGKIFSQEKYQKEIKEIIRSLDEKKSELLKKNNEIKTEIRTLSETSGIDAISFLLLGFEKEWEILSEKFLEDNSETVFEKYKNKSFFSKLLMPSHERSIVKALEIIPNFIELKKKKDAHDKVKSDLTEKLDKNFKEENRLIQLMNNYISEEIDILKDIDFLKKKIEIKENIVKNPFSHLNNYNYASLFVKNKNKLGDLKETPFSHLSEHFSEIIKLEEILNSHTRIQSKMKDDLSSLELTKVKLDKASRSGRTQRFYYQSPNYSFNDYYNNYQNRYANIDLDRNNWSDLLIGVTAATVLMNNEQIDCNIPDVNDFVKDIENECFSSRDSYNKSSSDTDSYISSSNYSDNSSSYNDASYSDNSSSSNSYDSSW